MFAEADAVAEKEDFRVARTGWWLKRVVELFLAQPLEEAFGEAARAVAVFLEQALRQPLGLRDGQTGRQLQRVFPVATRQFVVGAEIQRRGEAEAVGDDAARRPRHGNLEGAAKWRIRRQL